MSGRSMWDSAKNRALGRGVKSGAINARARCAVGLVKEVLPSTKTRTSKPDKGSTSQVRGFASDK